MKVLDKMDWKDLKHEEKLGCDVKKLLPWSGLIVPFGGAWGVVKSGTRSLTDQHKKYELNIVISGKAKINLGEDVYEVEKGDVIVIPSNISHYYQNEEQEDFHVYSLWWDKELAEQYLKQVEA